MIITVPGNIGIKNCDSCSLINYNNNKMTGVLRALMSSLRIRTKGGS